MVHNSLFGFSVQFHLAALTWGDWKDKAHSLSVRAPLLVCVAETVLWADQGMERCLQLCYRSGEGGEEKYYGPEV